LVNYSSYPVDNVTVRVVGEFHRAWLYTPEAPDKKLDVYKVDEGTGVDIDQVNASATLRLE
jgi:hypothetical protein